MKQIEINTKKRIEIIDITDEVQKAVQGDGIVLVYTPHTTTAITVNEDEKGLLEDILGMLKKLIPSGAGYRHDRIDNNADAHLRASIIGNSAVIPLENGRLLLGTWQRILFIELDGPRRRRVYVKVV
jgi:secondary thiamine-phosphate synthase enzyme